MLTVTMAFTKTVGIPATGLALIEIDLYLVAVAKADGAQTQIWDGTAHPTDEIPDLGTYLRQYSGEDFYLYDYVAGAHYTGVETLDSDWITGAIGITDDIASALLSLMAEVTNIENDLAGVARPGDPMTIARRP